MLVFALFLVAVVEQIPLAALAGLLLVMGFRLVKTTDIATAHRHGELWVYLATLMGVLALNLVEGVLIGRWLEHAKPSLAALRNGHPVGQSAAEQGYNTVDQLGQVNVAVALDQVREVLGEDRCSSVQLIGLFFRIEDGTVHVLRDDRFVNLTDAEWSELDHLRQPAPA